MEYQLHCIRVCRMKDDDVVILFEMYNLSSFVTLITLKNITGFYVGLISFYFDWLYSSFSIKMIFFIFVGELLNILSKHFAGKICIVNKEGNVSKNKVCQHSIFVIHLFVNF